jgi:hypothetical protein
VRTITWIFLGGLAAAPGCGGKVVFVDAGAGAAAASEGPGDSNIAAGPSVSVTTMSSNNNGPGEPACSNKCAAQAQVGCSVPPGCDASCQSVFAKPNQGCNAALAKYYECFAANPAPGCQMQEACSLEIMDYFACFDAKCTVSGLSAPGDGSCTGDGQCGGHAVRSTCIHGTCTCMVDGIAVGTCSDGTLDAICGFDETCCTSFYPG